ncbi:MAG: hypothetical protein ACSLFI_00195 [Solirubrobacterales bacterium]
METCDVKAVVQAKSREKLWLNSTDGAPLAIGEMFAGVRRLDVRSDVVLAQLLSLDDAAEASLIVVEALLPMMLPRAAGDNGLLDDLMAEVAIVFHEMRGSGAGRRRARLANYIMDTAWDRCRRERRSQRRLVPVDSGVFADIIASHDAEPERAAVNQVALVEFDERMRREGATDRVLLRSWIDALELSDRDRTTPAEQDRWKYVRRVLRRYTGSDLVA